MYTLVKISFNRINSLIRIKKKNHTLQNKYKNITYSVFTSTGNFESFAS